MDTPDDIKAWRKARRAELLARREAVPVDVRREWNERVTRLLTENFSALAGCVVGFCWPFKGEVDARFFIRHLRQRGSIAALPAVVEKKSPLQFREWWPGVAMTAGVFDLPVPDGTRVLLPDALLIPPVGFGPRGYRLGYGGGYFDRTLAAIAPQPIKIAVAFEVSRMETIYPQPYDVPMDFIVTEAGVHAVVAGGLVSVPDAATVRHMLGDLMAQRGLPRR
jgi:5,10-methenyltetrahydrofolate synthetase